MAKTSKKTEKRPLVITTNDPIFGQKITITSEEVPIPEPEQVFHTPKNRGSEYKSPVSNSRVNNTKKGTMKK